MGRSNLEREPCRIVDRSPRGQRSPKAALPDVPARIVVDRPASATDPEDAATGSLVPTPSVEVGALIAIFPASCSRHAPGAGFRSGYSSNSLEKEALITSEERRKGCVNASQQYRSRFAVARLQARSKATGSTAIAT